MTSSDELILYGVFRGLRARNIPLGIRDYLDALRAMRLGFGRLGREPLRRLCHALWARSPREARLIDLLFEEIPLPTDDEVRMADETPFEREPPGQRAD